MSQQPYLHEKRAAYESLSNHLTQLPKKLTHPGLIPIAPRLYLPGELVRTNEILVLLGRSGEASYFAERTAWQAHQIVRRRLGHVEHGLRELLAGVGQVTVTERPPSRPKKRVTFRDPVVCASPPLKAHPHPTSTSYASARANDTSTPCAEAPDYAVNNNVIVDDAHPSQAHVFSTGWEDPDLLRLSNSSGSVKTDTFHDHDHAYHRTANFSQEYMDVLRAAELDEDSSEDDMQQYINNPGDHYSQFISQSTHAEEASPEVAKPSNRSQETEIKKLATKVSVTNGPEVQKPGEKPAENNQESAREKNKDSEQLSMRSDFHEALRNAERQVREDGVVNLMEFYEDQSDLPTRVELPPDFRPDGNIDFEDGIEDYLDMTGESAKANAKEVSVSDNYVEFLKEEARKEEAEERRKEEEKHISDTENRRDKLDREKKEFGTGLAKGFLGAPSSKRRSIPKEQNRDPLPASQVQNPEVSELQETGAVQEKVFERKTSRKSSRRSRRPQATAMPDVISVAVSQQVPNVEDDERAGRFTRPEHHADTESQQLSKFRQLRKLQRTTGDGDSNR